MQLLFLGVKIGAENTKENQSVDLIIFRNTENKIKIKSMP